MRDQPALRVDDIGMPMLADLDLRDHVPDQLEVHLGDTHARVAPGAGNRERHIRLGLAPEIDWPVIYLARYSLRKLRVVGEVGAAGDHVHGQPRDPQTLFAAGIELRKLGNGGYLAQQPQCIEAALLNGACRPGQLCRPTELALDLLDELPDLGGGGFRLFALDADERSLVLLVVEVDIENAVREQRDADDRDEQRDIFGEQAPTGFGDRSFARRLMLYAVARDRQGLGGKKALNQTANGHPNHCTRVGQSVSCARSFSLVTRSPRRRARAMSAARQDQGFEPS